jgi:hypothetical protein
MEEIEGKKDLIKAGIQEISNFINKYCGYSLDQIAGMSGDFLGYLRLKRLIKITRRVEELLTENNIKPSIIDIKILIPALNYSSLENDEQIKEKWAALLANASNYKISKDIKPIFVEILNQITSKEACILDYIYDEACREYSSGHRANFKISRYDLQKKFNLISNDFSIIADNLFRLGVCKSYESLSGKITRQMIKLTYLGIAFIEACRFG